MRRAATAHVVSPRLTASARNGGSSERSTASASGDGSSGPGFDHERPVRERRERGRVSLELGLGRHDRVPFPRTRDPVDAHLAPARPRVERPAEVESSLAREPAMHRLAPEESHVRYSVGSISP